jgi:hypothetical protein
MKRLDVLIIAILLAVSGLWLAARALWPDSGGASAEIYVEGQLRETLPLSLPQTEEIETAYGYNTIAVESGSVRVTAADCPGGDCLRTRATRPGEVIACLPHHLLIRVVGGEAEGEVDIVAG